MKYLPLIFLISSFSYSAPFEGFVYEDTNANGNPDSKEKRLANILVTDGLNVVKTDKKGKFTLPGHPKGKFIYITTPAGYKIPKHYIPISTEENTKQSFQFGLQKHSPSAKNHHFIHISDTEISKIGGNEDWRNEIFRYSDNTKSAFVVHTGDICYSNGLKNHIKLMNTENMGIPIHYCIGNHDYVNGTIGEELFESLYGPIFYSFESGNVHYIITPMGTGDYKPGYSKEDFYRWLKNDLAQVPAGKPIIMFNHDLLSHNEQFNFGISPEETIPLHERNLKAWLYGHWHINFIKQQGTVKTIAGATPDKGGIDHSPASFRVVHVDEKGDTNTELRYSYIKPTLHLINYYNGMITARDEFPHFIVNAYSTVSPIEKMTYSCYKEGKVLVKDTPFKQLTDWSWKAFFTIKQLPLNEPHTIKVTAHLKNGDILSEEYVVHHPNLKHPTLQCDTNWENLLGSPNHKGIAHQELSLPLEHQWVTNVGGLIGMCSPVISEGNIYIGTLDEDKKGQSNIVALNGEYGHHLWKYPTRSSIKNSIVISGNTVLAQDAEGYLYAVDKKSGELRWEKKLNINAIPALCDGLVTRDGIVYAGTGKGLTAINVESGEPLWTNADWNQREGTTATLSLDKNSLVASVQWGALFGQDAQTGKKLWEASNDGLRMRASSPFIEDDKVYLISDKTFFILNAQTGETIQKKPLPFSVDVTSTPLVTEDSIIFGTVSHGLVALQKESLDLLWSTPFAETLVHTAPYRRSPSSTVETSPILSGNIVYVGASDGVLYALDKKSGSILWQYRVGAPIFSTPALSGNMLILADFGGNIHAFTPERKD